MWIRCLHQVTDVSSDTTGSPCFSRWMCNLSHVRRLQVRPLFTNLKVKACSRQSAWSRTIPQPASQTTTSHITTNHITPNANHTHTNNTSTNHTTTNHTLCPSHLYHHTPTSRTATTHTSANRTTTRVYHHTLPITPLPIISPPVTSLPVTPVPIPLTPQQYC